MIFDVRLPIGLLFLAIGAMVALSGVFGDPKAFEIQSGGVNIDLAWGLVMSVFGVIMLAMAALARLLVSSSRRD